MKTPVDIELRLDMAYADPKYTSLQGYLPEGTTYDQIVSVFGEPLQGTYNDGKTNVEWIGRINDLVFTIYDYRSSRPPKQNTNWHIGAKHQITADLVNALFKSRLSR